jgi:hypothetical protein
MPAELVWFLDGFILDENQWDTLPLDDFFDGHQLQGNKKKILENLGYLG